MKKGISTGAAAGLFVIGLLVGVVVMYGVAASGGLGAQTITITTGGATVTTTVLGGLCSGQKITIGVLTDLSGELSDEGTKVKQAVLMAKDDVNKYLQQAGCQLTVDLAIEDYSLDNQKALSQLQAMASQGIQAVVGPLNSGTAQFILQFADSNHILLVSPSSTSPALAIPNDFLFRTVPNDAAQGLAGARMMWDRGVRAVIIVNRHDTYGDGLANATATRFKQLGGTVVDIIPYDTRTTDFTPILQRIQTEFNSAVQQFGADKVAIYAITFEEIGTMLIQANQNFPSLLSTTQPWYGTDGQALNTKLISNSTTGPLMLKIRLPSTLYAPVNSTKTVDFIQRFRAITGVVPDAYTMSAYDDVWLIVLSALAAGKYDGQAMQKVFASVANNYFGLIGWTHLQPSGDLAPTMYQIWMPVKKADKIDWVLAGTWDAGTDTVTWLVPPPPPS
jgi:branched-chain amino acid transport system substrate-binding protein